MNKKGVALIIVITVIAIVVIMVVALMPQTVNQRQFAERSADSIRALYAAESGLNKAVQDLNAPDWSDWTIAGNTYTLSLQALTDNNGVVVALYDAVMDMTDPDEPIVEATGYVPPDPVAGPGQYAPSAGDAQRSIRADIARIEAAVIAKGDVEEKGNAIITGPDPDGDYVEEFAIFSFDNIFGNTMANVKAAANTVVVINPANNYEPVADWMENYTDQNANNKYDLGEPFIDANGNGECDEFRVTWFDVPDDEQVKISRNDWIGAALDDATPAPGVRDEGTILVVEGDIEITGGVFYGGLYVIGNLTFAAGNAQIFGTIFVDGNVEDTTEVKGTTIITYAPDKINDAFGYNPMPFARSSWTEIYK